MSIFDEIVFEIEDIQRRLDILHRVESGSVASSSTLHDPATLNADADVLLDINSNASQVISLDDQAANLIFASPCSGAASPPRFRALQNSDLPVDLEITQSACISGSLNVGTDIAVGGTVDGVDIAGFNAEPFLILGNSASLAGERNFAPGSGLWTSDGGANGTYIIQACAVADGDASPFNVLRTDNSGTVSVTKIGVGSAIVHQGDNTGINFVDDGMDFYAGAASLFHLVEGATDAACLMTHTAGGDVWIGRNIATGVTGQVLDYSTGRWGWFTNSPCATFDFNGDAIFRSDSIKFFTSTASTETQFNFSADRSEFDVAVGGVTFLSFDNDAQDVGAFGSGATDIDWNFNGAALFVEGSSDDVGIGTACPGQPLQIQRDNPGQGVTLIVDNTASSVADNAAIFRQRLIDDGGTLRNTFQIRSRWEDDSAGADETRIDFSTRYNGTIDTDFITINASRMGILVGGSPNQVLDVGGNIDACRVFVNDRIGRKSTIDSDTYIAMSDDGMSMIAGGVLMLDVTEATQDAVQFGPATGDVDINFNNMGKWRGSDWYFGIGTTNPNEYLHIAASDTPRIKLQDTTAGSSFLELRDVSESQARIDKTASTTNINFDVNGLVTNGTGDVTYRFGRATNTSGSNRLAVFRGDNTATVDALFTAGTDSVSYAARPNGALLALGTSAPLGKLHVEQSDTTLALPAVYISQEDVSEEFFEFETTIGTGNAIEAVGAKTLTTTHFLKVTINGVGTRYIPMGTIA